MNWGNKFKLALIQEDIQSLGELIENLNYEEVDLNEAKILIEEAIKLVSQKKNNQAFEIQKFQKILKYIKA